MGVLLGGLLGVDQRHLVAQPTRTQGVDLILHERDERRDHDGQVVAK
ncbi:MAG: hypothetical protein WKF31_01080 [Thermoleophilaceae bacterium]